MSLAPLGPGILENLCMPSEGTTTLQALGSWLMPAFK
jgi:hypothetical protein